MKKIIGCLILGTAAIFGPAKAGAGFYGTVSNQVVATTQAYTLDMAQNVVNSLSAQANYSSATIPAQTFGDGNWSTGTITVNTFTALSSASATDQITVAAKIAPIASTATITVISTTGLSGTILFVNGAPLAFGVPAADATANITVVSTTALAGTILYVNGNPITLGTTISIGATTAATASNLASFLNSNFPLFVSSATNSGSVVFSTAATAGTAGNFITLATSSSPLLSVSGPTFTGGINTSPLTVEGTPAATAANVVSFLNNSFATLIISTSETSGVIYATATTAGLLGNTITLATSSSTVLNVSGATFLGGSQGALNNAYFVLGGVTYLAGRDWKIDAAYSSTQTASNIAGLISDIGTTQARFAASTTTPNSVVYATAPFGVAGNLITLTASSGLTAASATFTGGQDNAILTIITTNGNLVTLTQGQQWTAATSSATTAVSIKNAIQANATLNTYIGVSTTSAGVVTATTTVKGSFGNFAWRSSTNTALAVSNTGLFGGTDTQISSGSALITIPNYGFPTGLSVFYSTTSGGGTIGGLTNNTTYYVIPITTNGLELAATSTGAVAGVPIIINSVNTTGGNMFTLSPITLTGGLVGTWQESDDNVNWTNISGASVVSFLSPYTKASTFWDFGVISPRWVRFSILGPTFGGANFAVYVNGK